ncbi:universal stress protein [Legionella tucsonensis]|uniref:Universal stress protein n=1 Tax=Legionella tucsonensis TaxID=40335 RepID=A0A0W0ZXZ1_9GAMM|nr:universal stress protein [Legionella tucsonensis]KTD73817.1 universal stress protein [Legionella tucsonensis]
MIYKHILVAVDKSNASNLALQEAVRLANDQNAKLRIIYIVEEVVVNSAEKRVSFDTLWNVYKEDGQDFLNVINERLKSSNIKYETFLIELPLSEGDLADKVMAEAQSWPADILVLGTHGRHGVKRFFIGSVAESVVRIATLPVLLIRG